MKVTLSRPTLCDPMDYAVHGIFQARILEWASFPFSKGSSNPGMEPRSPTLQVDSLPAEPQGKAKNTGVCSLSLLQRIFLTQELNRSLLHCRWILYQLSYKGFFFQFSRSVVSNSCDPIARAAWQATVHGIIQEGILDWAAISFSRGSSQSRN